MNEIDVLRIKKRKIDVEIREQKDKLHDLEEQSKEIGKKIVAKIEVGNGPKEFRTSFG